MSAGLLYAQDDIIAVEATSSQYIPFDVATSEVTHRSRCGNACCCLENWEVLKSDNPDLILVPYFNS